MCFLKAIFIRLPYIFKVKKDCLKIQLLVHILRVTLGFVIFAFTCDEQIVFYLYTVHFTMQ